MHRTVLLKLFCSFIFLQTVLTQNDLGEVIRKLRSNENEPPEWMETYLEALKNLDFPGPVTLSDLQSLDELLSYLNEDQSQLLLKNVDHFLTELVHSSFKFENEMKMKNEREPRKFHLNEDEGSGYSEEEDIKPILKQIFADMFLLKNKVIDLSKNIPLLIEMMEKESGTLPVEGNSTDVRNSNKSEENLATKFAAERSSLIGLKLKWIRQKAGGITGILTRYRVFDYIRTLQDYFEEQGNTSDVEELEEEIEDLLSEYKESDDPMLYWQEPEMNQMETENLVKTENEHSGVMSLEQESQSVPEELVTDDEENTGETNREARKLFDIKIEEETEHALNENKNKDGSVKIFRKTFKIFGKDELKKDQPKKISDEKWKVKVYNKVFKDQNTDKKYEPVADQTHYVIKETQTSVESEKATKAGETPKDNIFGKIFGNKDEAKMNEKENEKWKIKNFKKIIDEDESENEDEKLSDKDRNQKQTLEDGLSEVFKQSHKELESENSIYEKDSWKTSFYDKIRNKTEIAGKKTINITNYLGSITNDLYTAANESRLREIIEGIRDGKEDLTKNVRQKFSNVAKSLFQSGSELQTDESKTKPEGGEKWSLGNLNEGFFNTKENITNRIKEAFGNVKQNINSITMDTSVEDSPKLSKKSKLNSSPVSTEEYMEKPSYITVTSTYYTVLLTTTTTNVIYERTLTFTSTEVIETKLNPTATRAKSPSLKTKSAEKSFKRIESSSVAAINTETKSEGFKDVILDKFNLA